MSAMHTVHPAQQAAALRLLATQNILCSNQTPPFPTPEKTSLVYMPTWQNALCIYHLQVFEKYLKKDFKYFAMYLDLYLNTFEIQGFCNNYFVFEKIKSICT